MEVKEYYSYVCPDLVKEFNKSYTCGPSGLNSILESRQSQRKNFPLTLVMTDPELFFHLETASPDFIPPT